MTEAPRMPRFGDSCEKPQRSTTFVSGLSPIRVPPYACVVGPLGPYPSSPVAVSPCTHGAHAGLLGCDGAGRFVPLDHLVLDEGGDAALVVLVVGGDAADRET